MHTIYVKYFHWNAQKDDTKDGHTLNTVEEWRKVFRLADKESGCMK